jgi:hypothetical protein
VGSSELRRSTVGAAVSSEQWSGVGKPVELSRRIEESPLTAE